MILNAFKYSPVTKRAAILFGRTNLHAKIVCHVSYIDTDSLKTQ